MRSLSFAALVLLTTACGPTVQDLIDDTVILTIENRMGTELWFFQYSDCGADLWTEVIDSDEYVADGSSVSSVSLEPGCYDLYVEDELGCAAQTSTDGNLAGGLEFTWTVSQSDLTCP